ncbi:MAG: DUF2341 domain-containing protein, partial [Candidatus Pacebacteria bacterium]|nr:DUF2341 domain-containing protein [Candidatus Paceibacterota bacterium]
NVVTITRSGGTEQQPNWAYRRKITIDHTKVADVADPSTTYANFPVYVHATGLSNIKANGADIRFTASDGTTELPREIEKYDSGTLDAWVKVTLTKDAGDSSDDVIYMYYGDASATEPAQDSAYGRENVWDTNYKAVWHLDEELAGTGNPDLYQDSTSNNNDGNDYISATGQDGQISGGQEFDHTDDYISVIELNNFENETPVFTINTWIKIADSGANSIIGENLSSTQKEWTAYTSGLNAAFTFVDSTASYTTRATTNSPLTVGNWHMVTYKVSKTGGYIYIYVDGIDQALDSNSISSSWHSSYNAPFLIGNGRPGYFNGSMDEVRVSNIARSAEWIATE